MEEPKMNKKFEPPLNKTVKIKVNPNRAIAGVGKAGEIVEVSELVAKNFVAQGLATLVEEEK